MRVTVRVMVKGVSTRVLVRWFGRCSFEFVFWGLVRVMVKGVSTRVLVRWFRE